jgi:asparagine synthetase B (glutamine-hydrolysing)
MCGITAILASGGRSDALRQDGVAELLRRMTDAIEHRGPDGEGRLVLPFAALGHRRLAIIDLEAGAQPMGSADGQVQVVFNGEIYNHHALRAELEADGAQFRTRCDTEVLVEGYRRWGTDLPGRLRGMFAFAAHDQRSGETLIARDPIGKKPLYFARHGDLLLLSSETKSFLSLPGFAREIDPEALRELLACATCRVDGACCAGFGSFLLGILRCIVPAKSFLHASIGDPTSLGPATRRGPRARRWTWRRRGCRSSSRTASRRGWRATCRWGRFSRVAWTRPEWSSPWRTRGTAVSWPTCGL